VPDAPRRDTAVFDSASFDSTAVEPAADLCLDGAAGQSAMPVLALLTSKVSSPFFNLPRA
jgi:hypothetical protein